MEERIKVLEEEIDALYKSKQNKFERKYQATFTSPSNFQMTLQIEKADARYSFINNAKTWLSCLTNDKSLNVKQIDDVEVETIAWIPTYQIMIKGKNDQPIQTIRDKCRFYSNCIEAAKKIILN